LKNNGQIANYVNNGSFEDLYNCIAPSTFNDLKVKFWSGIDTTKNAYYVYNTCFGGGVPNTGSGYQYPRSGGGYVSATLLCDINVCSQIYNRGNLRNKLKNNLIAGKTYCVKYYVNIINFAAYGIDGFGAWFSDNIIDTIHYGYRPLTYIIPQIQNSTGNIITDTLNWVPITGTFVANGTEKYMVLGNFKTDANTMTSQIQATVSYKWCDVNIDDVSCIPLDLPAYAGPDIYGIPTTTVYLGRAQDVGIDEACMWYHLPTTTTAIDTAAGITVTVATTTQTYMVKQDICGVIKYDTVVVYASALGLNDLRFNIEDLKFYPNPTTNELNIEFINVASTSSATELQIEIYNSLGQILREEKITFKENKAIINTKELANGVYVLSLFDPAKNDKLPTVSKRFVIAR
jgi:hypothetical protein